MVSLASKKQLRFLPVAAGDALYSQPGLGNLCRGSQTASEQMKRRVLNTAVISALAALVLACIFYFQVSLLANRIIIGMIALLAVILAADVWQRKQTQTACLTSGTTYRELFESNPQPMWVFDQQTLQFLAINNAAVQ